MFEPSIELIHEIAVAGGFHSTAALLASIPHCMGTGKRNLDLSGGGTCTNWRYCSVPEISCYFRDRTLEVVDTAFGALHSCERAEEVYPP